MRRRAYEHNKEHTYFRVCNIVAAKRAECNRLEDVACRVVPDIEQTLVP